MKSYGFEPELPDGGQGFVCGREGNADADLIRIGRLSEYGPKLDVFMDVGSEKVIAIFGKRGEGKSYTLGSIIEGLVTLKPGSSISRLKERRAVLLLDTLNIYQWMNVSLRPEHFSAYPEIKKQGQALLGWNVEPEELAVKVWSPAGFDRPLQRDPYEKFYLRVCDFSIEDWGLLLGLDTVRDIKGQLLSEVHSKVTGTGWDSRDGRHVEKKESYAISDLLDCLDNDVDYQNGAYHRESVRAVRQQMLAFSRLDLFRGDGTPLCELLRPGQASVLLLNRLSQDMRGVLVSVLVRRLLSERGIASEATKNLMVNPNLGEPERSKIRDFLKTSVPKTWVVIDEAQNVIPSEGKTFASASLVKLVKEGRNFGLSFVVTSQQPRSLDRSVMSQVETFVLHKLVSQQDIDYVMENMKCPFPETVKEDVRQLSPRELMRDIGRGQVIVSDTNSPRAFVMQVRPRVSVHGGFEA
jgi:hypothetical protein